MKKTLLLMLPLLLFASCSKSILSDEDEEVQTNQGLGGIDLVCKVNEDVASTRASNVFPIDSTKIVYLAWALLDHETGEVVDKSPQLMETDDNSDDTDTTPAKKSLDSLHIDCKAGTYDLVLFAGKGYDYPSIGDGGVVTMGVDRFSESYAASKTVTIKEGERTFINCTLKHCVADIRIISTDIKPDNVTHFKVDIKGGCNQYNILEGYGVGDGTDTRSYEVEYQDFDKGKTMKTNCFIFLPKNGATVSTTFTIYDEDDNIQYVDIFDNLKAKPNIFYLYNGKMFDRGVHVNGITVDDSWDVNNKDLKRTN